MNQRFPVLPAKYVQTKHGVFPLRYFFSGGLKGEGGEKSARGVKEMIRELVANEDKRHPLTDREIVDTLRRGGIKIARRTVGKYRNQLKILPAKSRRRVLV
jgi:RNA polymerase sigma-54 factor